MPASQLSISRLSHNSVPRKGPSHDSIRRQNLLSKILMRILHDLERRQVEPTPEMMDAARKQIENRDSLSDREVQHIVQGLVANARRSKSALDGEAAQKVEAGGQPPTAGLLAKHDSHQNVRTLLDEHSTLSAAAPSNVEAIKALLSNTTRRERLQLADAVYIESAERDRVAGIEGKKQDRLDVRNRMQRQREQLDQQIHEHEEQAEADRKHRQWLQDEMTRHVETHRQLTQKEKEDAHNKALNEKRIREQQTEELQRQREENRNREHNEQVRHTMMVREEIKKENDAALAKKMDEKSEWKRVVEANQERLMNKAQRKEMERAIDRKFQQEYADQLDRQERERAAAKARKDARSKYFQELANGVAHKFLQKQQDMSSKIEAEFQEQLRRAMEDERLRKENLARRTTECQTKIVEQMAEKKRNDEVDRDASRREAELIAQQIEEAKRQEHARHLAARAEANRLQQFLATQLQMQHFKEAQPLETSIARPQSRAKTMFTPSRYSPSLKAENFLGTDSPRRTEP